MNIFQKSVVFLQRRNEFGWHGYVGCKCLSASVRKATTRQGYLQIFGNAKRNYKKPSRRAEYDQLPNAGREYYKNKKRVLHLLSGGPILTAKRSLLFQVLLNLSLSYYLSYPDSPYICLLTECVPTVLSMRYIHITHLHYLLPV